MAGVQDFIFVGEKTKHKYTVANEKPLGQGGEAVVFIVRDNTTNELKAAKLFMNDHPEFARIKWGVIDNVMNNVTPKLFAKGVKDFIVPEEAIYLEGNKLGYIMGLLPSGFETLASCWTRWMKGEAGAYPDDETLLKIIYNMAAAFNVLGNGLGYVYKDINHNNVFVNTKTGEVRIIDTDNIGTDKGTILGTPGFMAPELYPVPGRQQMSPYIRSEQFSVAVWLYWLLMGDDPFFGKNAIKYMNENNVLRKQAMNYYYGENPIFVFDSKKKENTVDGIPDRIAQKAFWAGMPEEIKMLFRKTFEDGMFSPTMRAGYDEWMNLSKDEYTRDCVLIKDGCPKCGKKFFRGRAVCTSCGCKDLLKYTPKDRPNPDNYKKNEKKYMEINNTPPARHKNPVVTTDLSVAEAVRVSRVQDVKGDGNLEKKEMLFKFDQDVKGVNASSTLLANEPFLLRMSYSPKSGKVGVKNLSSYEWTVRKADGEKIKIEPGKMFIADVDDIIRVIKDRLQYKIKDFRKFE